MKPGSPQPLPNVRDRWSYSFYRSDLAALADLLAAFGKRGFELERTQLIRFLLQTVPEDELFKCAVFQHAEDALKDLREKENVAERFTVSDLGDSARKLDRVIARLGAKGIRMNDSYVVRSLLRRGPKPEELVPALKTYLKEFPDGRTAAGRAKRGKRRGA